MKRPKKDGDPTHYWKKVGTLAVIVFGSLAIIGDWEKYAKLWQTLFD